MAKILVFHPFKLEFKLQKWHWDFSTADPAIHEKQSSSPEINQFP